MQGRLSPGPSLTFRLGLAQDAQHLSIGGILAQGPQHVPTLPVGDLHLSTRRPVKQRKGLFELCGDKTQLQPLSQVKGFEGQGSADQLPPRPTSRSLWLIKYFNISLPAPPWNYFLTTKEAAQHLHDLFQCWAWDLFYQ